MCNGGRTRRDLLLPHLPAGLIPCGRGAIATWVKNESSRLIGSTGRDESIVDDCQYFLYSFAGVPGSADVVAQCGLRNSDK